MKSGNHFRIKKFIKIGLVTVFSAGLMIAHAGILATSVEAGWFWENNPSQEQKGYVTIKGSDTMVHLVSSWAETFMQRHPDREISVTGGGSGTGIAALINGTTDICAASRGIKEKEKKLALKRNITPKEIAVALDGIAVVVNPENPVNTLTLEQIRKIFTGAYTNWHNLDAPDERIIVLSRDSSSGTYVFFQKRVLNKEDYTQEARLMPATSAIIQSVSTDKGAIGYVGLGYALKAKGKVKIVKIKLTDDSAPVTPSEESVKSNTYPIARKLYFYINDKPDDGVNKFITFSLSKEGQKIVTQTGYVPIK